jgi:prepilin-type N-terminal cleavage/methylation domain-containing protein
MYPTARPDFAPTVTRRITRRAVRSTSLTRPAGRAAGAFTLVEMLVVIAILGILMSAITVAVIKVIGRAKIARARNEIHTISIAVMSYCRDVGEMPPDTGYGLPTSPGSKLYDPGRSGTSGPGGRSARTSPGSRST